MQVGLAEHNGTAFAHACTKGASSLGWKFLSAGVPAVVGRSFVLTLSLMGIGRPCRGRAWHRRCVCDRRRVRPPARPPAAA